MLRLYRSLRRRFVRSGNVKQYLIYSIGEIGLIVVGILIALAISNRNEKIQTREVENQLLREFYDDLSTDISALMTARVNNREILRSTEKILSHLDNNRPYDPSLNYHFAKDNQWEDVKLSPIAYYNLKAHGLHFLKNKMSRYMIPDAYETVWQSYTEKVREQEDFYNLHVFPLLFDEFEAVSRKATCYSGAMIPLDYEKLRKEQKYAKILRARYEMRIQMLESLSECYLKMVAIEFELRKMIDFDTNTERERSPELVVKTRM